jgi:hypothetical protein
LDSHWLGGVLPPFKAVLNLSSNLEEVALSAGDRLALYSVVWYKNPHVLIDVLHEIGFAALIALLIFVLVERASKLEQENSANIFMQRISRGVLEAAYGIRTNPGIVRHVITNVLATPILRTDMRQTLTLDAIKDDGGDAMRDHLLLRVTSGYEIQNVSGGVVDWPITIALPRINSEKFNKLMSVTFCSIGGQRLTQSEIDAAEEQGVNWEKRFRWVRQIESNSSLSIDMHYDLVKEISDNEPWTSLLTTEKMEVVVDNRLSDVYWSLTPRTSAKIVVVDAPNVIPWGKCKVTFRTTDPLLAFQGYTVWWRPNEMDSR